MPLIDDLQQDVRFGLRLLRKSPVLSGATILTLALGIGLDAGVFNLIDGAMFRPRVEYDPSSFVQIDVEYEQHGVSRSAGLPYVTGADYDAFRAGVRSIGDLAAWSPAGLQMETPSGANTHHVALLVTCNFFRAYGPEQPILGRLFRADECAADAPSVVVIGEDLWRTQFAADPAIVGSTVLINKHPVAVVGVMPSGYAGQLRGPVWLPYSLEARVFGGPELAHDRSTPWLVMVGRLAAGTTRQHAAAELSVIARGQDRFVGDRKTRIRITNGSLIDLPNMRAQAFWIVPLIMGSLSLVLLLACGNVTMLLLSQAAARRHEIAVRISLGASRSQLLRMLMVESLILAAVASAPAVWLVFALPRVLRATMSGLPVYPFQLDGTIVVYLAGIAIVAGIVASIAPALESLRQDVVSTLHGHDALVGSGRGSRIRDALVAAQVALCLVLLVGAGVFVRAEYRLVGALPGYDADRVLLTAVRLSATSTAPESGVSVCETLRRRIAAGGRVPAAACATAPPVVGDEATDGATTVRMAAPQPGAAVTAIRNAISPDYFTALGIPIVAGRAFYDGEGVGVPSVIVSESLARVLTHGESPLGALIEAGTGTAQVVGIAADVRSLAGQAAGERVVYEVQPPRSIGGALLVRFDGDARLAVRAIHDAAASLHLELVAEPRTMTAIRSELAAKFLRIVGMVIALGGVAALLAIIGIYAVAAFAVSRRTREMGIRSALGASRGDLLRLVLSSSTRPLGIGLAGGLVFAAVASRAVARVFQNAPVPIDARDPVAYVVVAGVLALVAVAAMLRPAWLAAKAAPIDALRRD